jgi:hypothetical protein
VSARLIGEKRLALFGWDYRVSGMDWDSGMQYSTGTAILVSQSTDKVTRCWLGLMGINHRIPWEVRSGIVSRGFPGGYSAGLPPVWCGLSVSSTAAEFGELRKRRQIPCQLAASVPYNIRVLNVEAR